MIKYLQKLTEQHYKDTGKMLKVTMAIGWGLSSLAQIGAIMINDKIPAKEKRFLIPQEIYDGAINVALFIVLTSRAQKFGKRLLDKGQIQTAKSLKSVEGFENGFLTLASLVGSALASNIFTPIVRNKLAAHTQSKITTKKNSELYEFKSYANRSPSSPRPYDMNSFLKIAKSGSLKI